MSSLVPWANGPFELLVHAEGHLRKGDDFDRRMALISFDNAIDVAITTYLTLHPIQRGNREYKGEDVGRWLKNYHSKLEFLEIELTTRSIPWDVPKSYVVWAHGQRNEQYHGGSKGIPEKKVLATIRRAALWVFGVLYEVADVENLIEAAIAADTPPHPVRRPEYDRVIDGAFEVVALGGQRYYASELLFGVDPVVYEAVARDLLLNEEGDATDSLSEDGGLA